jgi:4-alpha-glucanotransferase
MSDTEMPRGQDIMTLPSEIVTEAKKFASLLREHAQLLEAAAKMKKAAADAHVPELAQQLHKFWRDQSYDERTVPEVEDFCEKIAVYLHRFLPWDAISEITSWQRWDDEEGWGQDTSLLFIGAAASRLHRREERRKYARKYREQKEKHANPSCGQTDA